MEDSSAWEHPVRSAAARRTTSKPGFAILQGLAYRAGEESLGQVDLEDGTRADLALDGDAPTVHLHYLLAYCQPQTATPARAGAVLVYPVKTLEELVEILLGDANARVLDAHGQGGCVLVYLDVDPGAGVGVLDGVVYQVEEDLVELLHVADAPVLTEVAEVDPDSEPLGFGLHGLYGGQDDGAKVGRTDLELVLPGIHLGEGHELLDHPPYAPELLVGQLERPVLQRVKPLARPLEQTDRALDGGERGPELVREVRYESRLGLLQRTVLGYVPDGQYDAGVPVSRHAVLGGSLAPVHLGGVRPVGFLSQLDFPYRDPVCGGLAHALQDAARDSYLLQSTSPVRGYDAEHPGRRGVDHGYALVGVRGDDGLGGGLQDGLEAAFLLLYLPDVVLYLLGHVVERAGHLAELVPALNRHSGRVIPRGDPYGRIARLGERPRDLAREENARRPGQNDAREYGPEYAVAQVGERVPELVAGNVVDENSLDGAVRGRERPQRHVARAALAPHEPALTLRRGGGPLELLPADPKVLVGFRGTQRVSEAVTGGQGLEVGPEVQDLQTRGIGHRLDQLIGVGRRRGERVVLRVAQALQKVLGAGVRRLRALFEQRVLFVDQPVLGEIIEDQTDDQARHRRDTDERHEDPGPETQGRRDLLSDPAHAPLDRPGSPVPDAGDGLYDLGPRRIVFYLGPEPAYVHVYVTARQIVRPRGDGLGDLGPRERLPRSAHEQRKYLELGGRDVQRLPATAYRVAVRVELQSPQPQEALPAPAVPPEPPEDGLDPGEQLLGVEGLGDVVVGPELEPDHLVYGLALGREQHHGNVTVLPHLLQYLEPAHPRQHDVENHEIQLLPTENPERLDPVLG